MIYAGIYDLNSALPRDDFFSSLRWEKEENSRIYLRLYILLDFFLFLLVLIIIIFRYDCDDISLYNIVYSMIIVSFPGMVLGMIIVQFFG